MRTIYTVDNSKIFKEARKISITYENGVIGLIHSIEVENRGPASGGSIVCSTVLFHRDLIEPVFPNGVCTTKQKVPLNIEVTTGEGELLCWAKECWLLFSGVVWCADKAIVLTGEGRDRPTFLCGKIHEKKDEK